MRRGEETPPLLDSFKTLCSRMALTPTQWGKEAAWAPCATVSQCQFSKVPASDATRKLSNQEAPHWLLWFWDMQVAVGFCHSADKPKPKKQISLVHVHARSCCTWHLNVPDAADDCQWKIIGSFFFFLNPNTTTTHPKSGKKKKNQAVAACQWECVGCCTLINRVVYSQLQ